MTSHSPRANDLHARLTLFAPRRPIVNVRWTFLYHREERAARARAWSERLKRGTNSSRATSGRWSRVFFLIAARPVCERAVLRRTRVTSRRYVANSWAWSNVFPAQFTVSTARCICSQSRVRFKCEFMMRPTRSLYPHTSTPLGSKCLPRGIMSGSSSICLYKVRNCQRRLETLQTLRKIRIIFPHRYPSSVCCDLVVSRR